MEFKIRYYSETGELLAEEVLNFNSYDQAENTVVEYLKEEVIKIKKNRNGREERILILTDKIARVSINDNEPIKVGIKPF